MRRSLLQLALSAACFVLPAAIHAGEIDTEHLFPFTMGSDVGEPGEREIETSSNGRFGKRLGSYAATSHQAELEYTPIANVRLSGGPIVAYHDISGVDGLDDRRQAAFQGLTFDMRYRLLKRSARGFGLTVSVEPHWARIDEVSGARADQYGVDVTLAVDHELVPDRLIAAANLLWQPDATRSRVTDVWSRESTLGVSAAVMARLAPGIFIGSEARYLRRYDGIGPSNFEGYALFVGPSLFATLSERCWVAIGWNAQVMGRSVEDPAGLDLANFERHHVRLNFGINF